MIRSNIATVFAIALSFAASLAACGPIETASASGASGAGGSVSATASVSATGVGGGGGGGGGAEACSSCDDGNPCTSDFCESGECKHAAYTSQIPCSVDGSKTCIGGVCQ